MSLQGSAKGRSVVGSINRLYELKGYSAYEVAVLNGFEGTEEEWLASLKGEKGDKGDKGDPGEFEVGGEMDMGNSKIVNVGSPTNDGDAVNLGYANANYAPKSHVESKNNPHVVTKEQIGAAPSGYGLGTGAIFLGNTTDLNDIKENGWYHFNAPTNKPFSYAHMHVVAGNDKDINAHQVYFSRNEDNAIAIRQLYGGTWKPAEYINPPMVLGTEYRTIERWQGLPVYTKIIDCGAMPVNTRKQIWLGVNAGNVLRVEAVTSNGETIPMTYDGKIIDIYASANNIHITSNFDASAFTAYARIWYTKK